MMKINEFDLGFVVDTTGSMSGLIQAAQKQMIDIVDSLSAAADVDMQLAVVEYRDHPPQDTMLTRVHPLTGDLKQAKRTINNLSADGGGDLPEAVFAGIVAACQQLDWRKHSRRIAILVGDAPPHGVGCHGDGFPRGCPSGETIESVSAKVEEAAITLYALGLHPIATKSFELLSRLTGGRFFKAREGEDAIGRLSQILRSEFGELEFDRQVHSAWHSVADPTVDAIAQALEATPPRIASSVSRLQSRGLLTV